MDQQAKRPGAVTHTIRQLGPFVTGLVVLCAVLPALGGFAVIGLAPRVKDYFGELGPSGAALYAALFAATTGLALMPTYALSGVAGFVFGLTAGSWVAMTGVVGGALIGYVGAGLIARRRVMGVIDGHERARIIRGALVDRGFLPELGVVTLLRLPPNSPFAMTNLVMSTTGVRPGAYILGTAAGIAPRTLLAVLLGAGASATVEAAQSSNSTIKIVGLGVSVVVVGVLYVLFSRWSKEALRRLLGGAEACASRRNGAEEPSRSLEGDSR